MNVAPRSWPSTTRRIRNLSCISDIAQLKQRQNVEKIRNCALSEINAEVFALLVYKQTCSLSQCVCVRVCVCVIVKRPVIPPCAVDGRSRNPLYYHYHYYICRGVCFARKYANVFALAVYMQRCTRFDFDHRASAHISFLFLS